MKKALLPVLAALWATCALSGCGQSDSPESEAAPETVAAPAPAPVTTPAPAADLSAPVAKVNDTVITAGDVQTVLDQFMSQMGGQVPPAQLADALPRIRERIVEELIMRRVMLDAVARQGLTLSDDEFADIKAELMEELPPGVTLETYMAETGTTEAQLREQMTVRKMIIAQAEALPQPSAEDIQAFYEDNKDGFSQQDSVTASHILIKVDPQTDTEETKAAKRQRLEDLRQQIADGADFAELAKANSDCPSRNNGGDLGPFGRGQMVPEFEEAAFSQEIGALGDIVETQFGYHLIQVTAKTPAKTLTFEEVQDRIRDMLYSQQQQEAVRAFVDRLREQALIERMDGVPAEDVMLQLDAVEEELAPEAVAAIEEAEELTESAAAEAEEAIVTAESAVDEAIEAEAVAEEVADEAVEAVETALESEAVEENAAPAAEAIVEEAVAIAESAVEEAVEAEAAAKGAADEAVEAVETALESEAVAEEAAEMAAEEADAMEMKDAAE